MSKAFTRESDAADDDDELEAAPPLPVGARNYMTPGGSRAFPASSTTSCTRSGPSWW